MLKLDAAHVDPAAISAIIINTALHMMLSDLLFFFKYTHQYNFVNQNQNQNQNTMML